MLKIKKCSKGISECVMRGYWVTLCALIAAYPLPVFSATIAQLVARQRAVMERELDAKLRTTDASAFSVQPLPGTAASPARGARFFFFLMIRRPPRSTLFPHDALPI